MSEKQVLEISVIESQALFVFSEEHGYINGIDNEKLANEIINTKRPVTEDANSEMYEDILTDASEGTEAFKLIACMRKIAHDRGRELVSHWSIVHQPLESTDIHHHLNSSMGVDLSWVYWAKSAKNSGNLVFIIDNAPMAIIEPQVGKFLIFPSFLKHKVNKNMSGEIRVSLSGNFAPIGSIS